MTEPDLSTVLAEEETIMDVWARDYDDAALSNAYLYRLERGQFASWIARTVSSADREPGSASVLDAGCGTGDLLERLSRHGFEDLTGLDLSEGMLRVARDRDLGGARWMRGVIEDPPFERESFDLVIACFTVHHLLDPSAFFRLVDRVLRPGGWFFILDFDGGEGSQRSLSARAQKSSGELVRAAFAWKNRRALAAQPALPRLFNPGHRRRSFGELMAAMERPSEYEVRRLSRGVLLPALTLVLIEESRFDRMVARWAAAFDRRLAPRIGGVFQWVAGRRRLGRSTPQRGLKPGPA
jgi:ubiquinone/menaquinone biosynthesis C-methylase UbiE